jgi:hypothetical protein
MIERMYYCGQQNDSGHYIWPSDGSNHKYRLNQFEPGAIFQLDDPKKWCGHHHTEGVAKLTHLGGWTIFGFREYTIDDRPGSHSTFAAKGTYTAVEMEAEARRLFPQVWARFNFAVIVGV